ncbi:hypothetical protein F1559_001521 [Cyanidiococcus yangmingshanensis]|uniref:Uncharacterized protein n=1 Tax=Cyanidiococcus yangmingshanensis TaxID=2690220 RepID=A0A7J7IDC0_9RHOD|nr:hypothetical protein F1559_001521 [Cyanidiococcus yangmingshanensis]
MEVLQVVQLIEANSLGFLNPVCLGDVKASKRNLAPKSARQKALKLRRPSSLARTSSARIWRFLMQRREVLETTVAHPRWEEYAGNFILRPQPPSTQTTIHLSSQRGYRPKALIHFLGGAFAGAAPQIVYRWFLEQLSMEGYVVVTTPYRLSFDHLSTVDEVLSRFSAAAGMLALDYGDIPVIGIGHSSGALLQTISGSFFSGADGSRAINVLIAYNNRRAEDAIPLFREFIAPTVINVAETNELADALERLFVDAPAALDTIFDTMVETLYPSARRNPLLELLRQSRSLAQQLPPLFAEVADGATAFNPDPAEIVEAIRSMYKVRQTLLVSFQNDTLDDTPSLYRVLDMSRGATFIRVGGSHITPCTQDLLDPNLFRDRTAASGSRFEEFDATTILRESLRRLVLREASLLKNCVVAYLDRALEKL